MPTTLASPKAAGATSASLAAATGWSTTTPVHFKLYAVSVTAELVAGTETIWKATLSGTTLSNMQLKSGTEPAGGYATDSVVEPMFTSTQLDDLYDGLDAEHNADGTHDNTVVAVLAGAQTFTGQKTLTSPKVITDISDTNGNELFKLTPTSSAVNEFTVANAATGSGPTLSSTGGDTDVDINLSPKGAGKLKVGGNPFNHGAWTPYTPTFTNVTTGNGTITGAYVQIGKTVFWRAKVVLGSSSSVGSTVTVSLPVASVNYGVAFTKNIANVAMLDSSAGQIYHGWALWASTTTADINAFSVATFVRGSELSSTVPVTWATSDSIDISGHFEAA